MGGARFASMQIVKSRMKSVGNISKITKAMKMVAASRLRGVQTATENSRGFPRPFGKVFEDQPMAKVDSTINVPVTSDKGLCGGINSNVVKYTKLLDTINKEGGDGNVSIFIVGEKGRQQLMRGDTQNMVNQMVTEGTKVSVTFAQTSMIADEIINKGFDKCNIMYNHFKSVISFKPSVYTILTPEAQRKQLADDARLAFDEYEVEGHIKTEL